MSEKKKSNSANISSKLQDIALMLSPSDENENDNKRNSKNEDK